MLLSCRLLHLAVHQADGAQAPGRASGRLWRGGGGGLGSGLGAQERKDLAATLKDTRTVVGRLELLIAFVVHIAFIFFYLIIFQVAPLAPAAAPPTPRPHHLPCSPPQGCCAVAALCLGMRLSARCSNGGVELK